MVVPKPRDYLTSLHFELHHQANRVRNLIGDRHWLSDGKHKESLVAGVLARHLPAGYIVETGFVVHPADDSLVSKELDIMVVDYGEDAPLLSQFGFSICFSTSLGGVVSVKSAFTKQSFVSSLENWNSVESLANLGDSPKPWLGGVFFDEEAAPEDVLKSVKDWCRDDPKVHSLLWSLRDDHVVFGSTGNLIGMIQRSHEDKTYGINIFEAKDEAIAILMADLLEDLSARSPKKRPSFGLFVERHRQAKKVGSFLLEAPPDLS